MSETDISAYLSTIGADNLMKFAGVPDGIPDKILNKFWGYLNKQNSFANWSTADEIRIEEDLRCIELHELMSHTEDELIDCDAEIPDIDQVIHVAKGMATLGKNGYLLKQARTSNANYNTTTSNNSTGSNVLDYLSPKNNQGDSQ